MVNKRSLKLGQPVFFRDDKVIKTGTILELHADVAIIKQYNNRYEIPYYLLFKNKTTANKLTPLIRSHISKPRKKPNLPLLLKNVLRGYKSILKPTKQMENIKIIWGDRFLYYSNLIYYTPKYNTIYVTKALMRAPNYAIKYSIFLKLLHIKYRKKSYVKIYKTQFRKFESAERYIKLLLNDLHFNEEKVKQIIAK